MTPSLIDRRTKVAVPCTATLVRLLNLVFILNQAGIHTNTDKQNTIVIAPAPQSRTGKFPGGNCQF